MGLGTERRVASSTYKNIRRVLSLDSDDDSRSNHELLPGLGQVEVVDALLGALVNVIFHHLSAVLGSNMDLTKAC